MFHTDNAGTLRSNGTYFFHHLFFRFLFAKLAIGRDNQIEDKVDILFPLGHTEIVDRERFVHFLCRIFRQSAKLIYKRVVNDEGVEVNGDDAPKFLMHILFHSIDFFVCHVDITIGRHFGMERHNLSARPVIVYHNVVNTHDTGIIFHKLVNVFNKGRVGGRTKQ